MGGGTTNTTTQTSGLNNAALNSAVSTIGNQLNSQLSRGSKVFNQSLYPGISSQTQAGVNALTNNPTNSIFSGAMGNTIGEFGAIASGQRMGEGDAAWNAAKDNVIADTNSAFNASGRFGGGSNVEAVASGLGGLELSRLASNEARQMSAANMLPTLYGGSMMPASAQLQAGQIMDADALSRRQAEADLFDRKNNAGWNTLARASQVLAGTAPSAGTTGTTTQSQQVPWWQTGLGIGAGILGIL